RVAARKVEYPIVAGASRQLPLRLQGRCERSFECPATFDKIRNDNGVNSIRRLHQALTKPCEHGSAFGFGIARRVSPGKARIRLLRDALDLPSLCGEGGEQTVDGRCQPAEARDEDRRARGRHGLGGDEESREVGSVAGSPGAQFELDGLGPAQKSLLIASQWPA